MSDDATLQDAIQGLFDGLVAAQGIAFANREILREVVGELARAAPDHHQYLAGMFERISARMDCSPPEIESKEARAFQREMLAKFVSIVEQDIAPKSPSG